MNSSMYMYADKYLEKIHTNINV